jgi:hypothetical protein
MRAERFEEMRFEEMSWTSSGPALSCASPERGGLNRFRCGSIEVICVFQL